MTTRRRDPANAFLASRSHRLRGAAALIVLACLAATPASAAALTFSAADTGWMSLATVLVLLSATAGLPLLYCGLVRAKNATATLTQVFTAFCAASLVWFVFGYSVAFSSGTWVSFIGGFSKALLLHVKPWSLVPTHALSAGISEYAFFGFEMTMAGLAPALIVGAFVERMRFQAVVAFAVLWSVAVYLPLCHMMWFSPTPDALAAAARAAAVAQDPAARQSAEQALAALQADSGLFAQWGTIDFAGGLVLHISAGVAGLMGALAVGKRTGYGRENMAPHDLSMTLIGGALLWVGWLGLNAGGALGANGLAALAIVNSLIAAMTGALAWILVESANGYRPTLVGLISGMLSGLVAIAAGAGYVAPAGAMAIGLLAAPICLLASTRLKQSLGYDDSLDVFGIHCVGGVFGMLAVAVLASPDFGGTGAASFALDAGQVTGGNYDIVAQLRTQLVAVVVALLWSGYLSFRLFKLVDVVIGLRPAPAQELRGLDISDHGERAYN